MKHPNLRGMVVVHEQDELVRPVSIHIEPTLRETTSQSVREIDLTHLSLTVPSKPLRTEKLGVLTAIHPSDHIGSPIAIEVTASGGCEQQAGPRVRGDVRGPLQRRVTS